MKGKWRVEGEEGLGRKGGMGGEDAEGEGCEGGRERSREGLRSERENESVEMVREEGKKENKKVGER